MVVACKGTSRFDWRARLVLRRSLDIIARLLTGVHGLYYLVKGLFDYYKLDLFFLRLGIADHLRLLSTPFIFAFDRRLDRRTAHLLLSLAVWISFLNAASVRVDPTQITLANDELAAQTFLLQSRETLADRFRRRHASLSYVLGYMTCNLGCWEAGGHGRAQVLGCLHARLRVFQMQVWATSWLHSDPIRVLCFGRGMMLVVVELALARLISPHDYWSSLLERP